MFIFSAILVFVCVWWTVLFAVLPWGNAPEAAPALGHASSAPARPRIGKKFLVTTAISVVIWAIIMYLIHIGLFDFQSRADAMYALDVQHAGEAK